MLVPPPLFHAGVGLSALEVVSASAAPRLVGGTYRPDPPEGSVGRPSLSPPPPRAQGLLLLVLGLSARSLVPDKLRFQGEDPAPPSSLSRRSPRLSTRFQPPESSFALACPDSKKQGRSVRIINFVQNVVGQALTARSLPQGSTAIVANSFTLARGFQWLRVRRRAGIVAFARRPPRLRGGRGAGIVQFARGLPRLGGRRRADIVARGLTIARPPWLGGRREIGIVTHNLTVTGRFPGL